MSYPVVRFNTEYEELIKRLKDIEKRLKRLENPPQVIHVRPQTYGSDGITLDVYYTLTPTTMTVTILPFSITVIGKSTLDFVIPAVQIPVNNDVVSFLYLINNGSTRQTGEIKLFADQGTCHFQFNNSVGGSSFQAGSYYTPYRTSFSFVIC